MNLTHSDLILLTELDKNCRSNLSLISNKSRFSQQVASYKIKRYLEDELILSFNSFIDYVRLGYLNFRVFFKISYLSQERFSTILNELQQYKCITGVIECEGKYDIIAVFAALNPSEFNKSLRELTAKYPSQLKNYVILTTVITHYYNRTYLTPDQKDMVNIFRDPIGSDVILGGDRSVQKISKKDLMILYLIQSNARVSSTLLSKKLKLDPKTIRSRINILKEKGLIKTFKPIFNVQYLGFNVNKILLKYHNLSVKREQELLTFCKFNPHIIELIKSFGEWDLEITVETKTKDEFRKVFISIREKFEDIIADFESFPVFKTHKKEFLPKILDLDNI